MDYFENMKSLRIPWFDEQSNVLIEFDSKFYLEIFSGMAVDFAVRMQ